MLVSEILNKKSSSVFTMSPNDSVEDAIGMFKEKKIGAVTICDARGLLVGILTERDVLHSQAEIGAETFKLVIEEIMSQVYICKPDEDIKSVMRLMTSKRVRHVPVVIDGKLIGMVSIGDIVKNQLDEAQLEIDTMRDFARAH